MAASSQAETEFQTLKLTIILCVVAFAVKLVGCFLTGIMVLLADALHSLSDLFIYGFLLVAMIWSRKEADEVHMFGYRRAQNVGALVAATLFIAFTSYKLIEESVPRLFQAPVESTHNFTLAFVVIGISLVIPAIPILRVGTQSGGLSPEILESHRFSITVIPDESGHGLTCSISTAEPSGETVEPSPAELAKCGASALRKP